MKMFNEDNSLWLIPGVGVKRWGLLIVFAAAIVAAGLSLALHMAPMYWMISLARAIRGSIWLEIIGISMVAVGAVFFVYSCRRILASLSELQDSCGEKSISISEAVALRSRLNHGPKIVVVGGGSGLSSLLKGLKEITYNLTAVVTVGDDGGSSGKIREEMGILPPGDMRNCITALADDEAMITRLFQYRFANGGLSGHSFGNLFITALTGITGNIYNAVQESSKILKIRGQVLPATLDDMKLVARMSDGSVIEGESKITGYGGKIAALSTNPKICHPLPEALDAINKADLIVIGPGSLYTSIIPNLLVKDISAAISSSKAKKIYVCNIMTQPGETDGYSAGDHIKAILDHAGQEKLFDTVMINSTLMGKPPSRYAEDGAFPVYADEDRIRQMGLEIVKRRLTQFNDEGHVRHSSRRLAYSIYGWFRHRGDV